MGERTVVYTDGACAGNPGPGGWAWAEVGGGRYRSGCEAKSTNQRMEIWAAADALASHDGPLEIVSDSTYVVHCFRDRWFDGWHKRGWVNSAKKPVANRDLWEPFIDGYLADPTRVRFRWVKGHSGDKMNDLVDRLAVKASQTQRPDEAGESPTDLADAGPADLMPDDEVSLGTGVVVGGLKPPELGGYDPNPISAATVDKLTEILVGLKVVHPDLVVLTGMGLGAEQLGAEAAIAAGVPFVAALAFAGAEQRWPGPSKERYRDLVGQAREVVTVGRGTPDSPQKVAGAIRRRDSWLVDHASIGIVVSDGKDRFAMQLADRLRDGVGEEDVWVIDPGDLGGRLF